MAYACNPEFKELYVNFTADPNGIGPHLNGHLGQLSAQDPLLVSTGSDLVIFPGDGRAPMTQTFRNSGRGFFELTSISHLGIAVPYLVRQRETGYTGWRADAERLMAQIPKVQAVNSVAYWRDTVGLEAWAGMEEKITDLVDYSCDVTLDVLKRFVADPDRFTFQYLRDNFLDGNGPDRLPVPMNDMMAATFALVFLDSGYRIIRWLRENAFDWERMMVLLCGRAGRPTAALTWQSNSMCHMLWQGSGQKLVPERLYIAPHAPGLVLADLEAPGGAERVEAQFRQIWYSTRATVEMGRLMYEGYPAFQRNINAAPVVSAGTQVLSELPKVQSPDDRRGFVTLLRFVMEDPGQQLANASAHYIIDQLCANGNRPSDVQVPGFTKTVYPRRTPRV